MGRLIGLEAVSMTHLRILLTCLSLCLGCGGAQPEARGDVVASPAKMSDEAVAAAVVEIGAGWADGAGAPALTGLAREAGPAQLARGLSGLHDGPHGAVRAAMEAAADAFFSAQEPAQGAEFMSYLAEFARARGAYPEAQARVATAFTRFADRLTAAHPRDAAMLRAFARAAGTPFAYPSDPDLIYRRPARKRLDVPPDSLRAPFTVEMVLAGVVLTELSREAEQSVLGLRSFLRRAGAITHRVFAPGSYKKTLDYRHGAGGDGPGAQPSCAATDGAPGWDPAWLLLGLAGLHAICRRRRV